MSDLYTVGSWIGANLVGLSAILMGMQRALKLKDDKLAASKMETIQVLESNRDAWKDQAEDISLKYEKYREHTHKQLEEINAKILLLTEENGVLKSKTDMTPILTILDKLTEAVNKILDRLNV